jgi:segregation and condensation protein B
VIGHRDVPGRPALLATTRQFLDDLGLTSLEDLPPLQRVGQDNVPGGLDHAMQAMEQNLQSTLDQAAIDFSDGSAEQNPTVAVAVPADAADDDDAEQVAPASLQVVEAGGEAGATSAEPDWTNDLDQPEQDKASAAPAAHIATDNAASAAAFAEDEPAPPIVQAGTSQEVSGQSPDLDGHAETEDTLPEAKDDSSKFH